MNERRKISVNGIISVALALDSNDRLRGQVEIGLAGIPVEEDRDDFIEEAAQAAADAVAKGAQTPDKLREAIRLAVRRCASEWTGKKPVVDVLTVRL
jgi:ribonuclease J